MSDLPPQVLEDLLALGQLGDRQSAKRDILLTELKPFNRVNALGWDIWNAVARVLPEEKLECLVRGLTVAELELKWYGGSVASVIWIFRNYESRFPDRADELADWILARSKNPYVPYGRMRGSARSVAEYHTYMKVKNRRQEESKQEQEYALRRKKIRAEVRKRIAHEHRVMQEAHNHARNDLIVQLRNLSPKKRLEHIAWDDVHSLVYYPASFADVDNQVLQQLDKETRERLLGKLALRRMGPWKNLFKKSQVQIAKETKRR
ncbi:MAG TPA: hypothetical protein VH280_14550 [Verrucomicrobiae bacterium]|nr:hypothetical protein [Verrucomicrobiae bacterium]